MTDQYEDEAIDDPVLDKLVELEQSDKLDPETVVAEATDPTSELHTHFEWDDSQAAHQWRLQQARQLIRKYQVVRSDSEGNEVRYRKFTHVESQGRYHETDRALRDWREEILARARKDLRFWERRYQRLGRAAQLGIITEVIGDDTA